MSFALRRPRWRTATDPIIVDRGFQHLRPADPVGSSNQTNGGVGGCGKPSSAALPCFVISRAPGACQAKYCAMPAFRVREAVPQGHGAGKRSAPSPRRVLPPHRSGAIRSRPAPLRQAQARPAIAAPARDRHRALRRPRTARPPVHDRKDGLIEGVTRQLLTAYGKIWKF